MNTVFIYHCEGATSKAGRAYLRQRVQILQAPKRPDVFSFYFPETEADVLEPGRYTCNIEYRDSATGVKLIFDDFKKIEG